MSIASKIESISNHLENAYNSLENIGVDLTNINKNINNLSAQIESVYGDLPKTEPVEGTTLTIQQSKKGKLLSTLKGNSYQQTYTGKNLWGGFTNSYTTNPGFGTIVTNTDGTITLIGNGTASQNSYSITAANALSNHIYKTLSAGTYTASGGINKYRLQVVKTDGTSIATTSASSTFETSFVLEEDTDVFLRLQVPAGVTIDNEKLYFQLEKASSATSYEPYCGGKFSPNPDYPQIVQKVTGDNTITISNSDNTENQTYPINLGILELCKIGNYQDYFYKNTPNATDYSSGRTLNAWYLKKNINKVTFNGAENWDTQNSVFVLIISDILVQSYAERSQIMLSDRFKGATTNYRGSLSNLCISKTIDNAKPHQIAIRYDDIISSGASGFKTWLSTHNTTAHYVLETPIFTEITGTLATQLEALENAKSYNNQTNISQTNNDVPFIISASALLQNSN